MSTWVSYVAGEIHGILRSQCRHSRAGWVFPEGTKFQCFPAEPTMVRRTDVSFIRFERLSLAQAASANNLPIAPDLLVEVVAPNDTIGDIDQQIETFLSAGTRRILVVYPPSRTVHVHRANGPGTILRASDELTGEDLLPGFRCTVREFFLPPPGAVSAAPAPAG